MSLKSWLENAPSHASSRQWAWHHVQYSQGSWFCSFSFIPLCSAMFTDAPTVPPPIEIGLALTPRTLNWSRMLSTPSVCRAFPTHLINPSASAFTGTSSERYLTHDLISCGDLPGCSTGPTPIHLPHYLHQWVVGLRPWQRHLHHSLFMHVCTVLCITRRLWAIGK